MSNGLLCLTGVIMALPLCEQGRKPALIKAANVVRFALMQQLPEQTRFVSLLPKCKHVIVEIQLDHFAQIEFCGVVRAAFPVANALLRHAYAQCHLFLCQSGSPAQYCQLVCEVKIPRFVVAMMAHFSLLHQICSAKAKTQRGGKT